VVTATAGVDRRILSYEESDSFFTPAVSANAFLPTPDWVISEENYVNMENDTNLPPLPPQLLQSFMPQEDYVNMSDAVVPSAAPARSRAAPSQPAFVPQVRCRDGKTHTFRSPHKHALTLPS
jgi:hypothetical protein